MRRRIQAFTTICLAASIAVFVGLCTSPGFGQSAENGNGEKTTDKKKITLDELKLPPGSVLVLVDEFRKLAISKHWISSEAFKELEDELAKLKKMLREQLKPVHACRLTATVHDDTVSCRAQLTFTTELPNSRVFLGLEGAHFTDEGTLDDDDIPLLNQNKKGFDITVLKPGLHKLTLDFNVPLRLTGQMERERSFEFGLPGAAVTTLQLKPPEKLEEIRWNGKVARRPQNGDWQIALGTADNLVVSWKSPALIEGAEPLRRATANLQIEIDLEAIHVKSDCVLRDDAGKTKEWRLRLPPQAQVIALRGNGESPNVIAPTKKNQHYIIRTEKPTSNPIHLNLHWSITRIDKSDPIALGPLRVLGVFQKGRISIRAKPAVAPTTRYDYKFPKSTAVAALPGTQATFRYDWTPSDSALPLTIQIREEQGKLETQVDHVLHVFGVRNGWQVELTTTIHGRVLQGKFDHLDVRLPQPGWNGLGMFNVVPTAGTWAALPWGVLGDPLQQAVFFVEPMEMETSESGYDFQLMPGADIGRLIIPPNKKSFRLSMRGRFSVGPGWLNRIKLPLPTPVKTQSRSGKIAVHLENKLEFVRPDSAEPFQTDPHFMELSYTSPPGNVELHWKEHRPDFDVSVVSDVTVEKARASVRQTIEIPIPTGQDFLPGRKIERPPIELEGPQSILSRLGRVSGGQLLRDPSGKRVWIALPKELFDRHQLVLEYDFPLPPSNEVGEITVTVPFLVPEKATRITAKTRMWTERGVLPKLTPETKDRNQWKVRRLELVADRATIPSLVLAGVGKSLPLSITLTRPEQLRVPQIVIDRALIQVAVHDNAFHYRARFSVAKVNNRFLDVQLPGPVAKTLVHVALDGKGVNHWQIAAGEPNTLRLRLEPNMFSGEFLLEINYEVSARQAQVQQWQTMFYAPIFRGDVFVNRLRWQLPIGYQSAFFVLSGDAHANVEWKFHDGLWVPHGTISAGQLERWLTGEHVESNDTATGVVLEATQMKSLPVLHCARPVWLFICSGIVLVVGMGLFFAPVSRWAFWILLIVFGSGVVAIVAIWPTLKMAVLYGVQPGAAVLVLVFVSYWAWREWHRRKTVFMPGFTRTPHASSVVQRENAQSKSTVDAPAPSGVSSVNSNSN